MSNIQKASDEISVNDIQKRIYTIREQQVMLDSDLAEIFQIETKLLKQATRRNIKRFPLDFMFELTKDEQRDLRLQIEALQCNAPNLRLQIEALSSEVISPLSPNKEHFRYAPFVFTEHGITVLSGVLRNETAIQAGIMITRAFVQIKRELFSFDVQFASYKKRVDGELLDLKEKVDGILQRESAINKAIDSRSTSNIDQVRAIQTAVARHFSVTVEDLKSERRLPTVVVARHIAVYLVRTQLGLSLKEIGRHFGGRDHTTILYALEKIEHIANVNRSMDSILTTIRQ